MRIRTIRRLLGCVAFAVACMLVGSAMTMTLNPSAQAESAQTVVVTSPFTAAIAEVRGSVVGVSNYQMQSYGSYGNNRNDPFGFGFGFGYGYGYGNGRDQQPEQREALASTGSGVVISDKGFVLTNYHVVEDASRLTVTVTPEGSKDAQEHAATLVVYDENLDVAIVYAPDLGLPAVTLGDSDTMQVGDWAICIGNPLGFTNTTTVGIVSALNRGIDSESYDRYGRRETITNAMIQVDAAINSGNSGGGMFSVSGELMGIPTLKYTGSYFSGSTVEGIGMCIPINAAKPLIEQVLSGEVTATAPEINSVRADSVETNLTGKPRLGITISNLNSANRYVSAGYVPSGVYVSEVEPGSPAEAAGMLATDIIVEVNEVIVATTNQLQAEVAKYNAGDTLSVKVFRVPGGLSNNTTATDFEAADYIDLEVTLAVVDQTT